jgi:hypothetical protein
MPDTPVKAFTLRGNGILRDIRVPIVVVNPARKRSFEVVGIIDTGCNTTCISRRLIRTLELQQKGIATSKNSSAREEISLLFDAVFVLPQNIQTPLLRVADFSRKAEFEVLIGMDIITSCDLAITNDAGNTVVSFRKPHGPYIDFSR